MLRAAVIGLGVGARHAAGYRAHPHAELVAVCDLDPEKLARAAREDGSLRLSTDAAELLTDPEIDVVSIASYDDAHYEQIRVALEAGKHVFAEKPLCLKEREASELRAILHSNPRLRLSSNVPLRLSPRFVELKRMIEQGRLGRVFHVEGDYEYGRREKLTHGWRGRIPWYSAVLGGGIHMVDLLLWLTGRTPVEVVAARGGRIATSGSDYEHDDFAIALLAFEDDSTAKITANLGCVSPHFHGLRVYGSRGSFVNALPDALLHTLEDDGETLTTAVTSAYPGVAKEALLESFLDALASGDDPPVSEDDVFRTLSVCFAIERALREGGSTPIVPPG